MIEENTYIISVDALFYAMNNNRVKNGLTIIENSLIASKLGILFTLRTHGYINFKSEYVVLNDLQLVTLQEILAQYFNVEMNEEIRSLVMKQEPFGEATNVRHFTPPSQKTGFFNKIKGLFKSKPEIQEDMA